MTGCGRIRCVAGAGLALAVAALAAAPAPAAAAAAPAAAPVAAAASAVAPDRARAGPRLVRYGDRAVWVPRSWRVIDLSREPRTCVRFDRRAVYLGTPGPDQRCPAHAVGRREAILISPSRLRAATRRDSAIVRPAARRGQVGGSVFTGLGFDACQAPSMSQMAAWLNSPYRAVGIYIGGENEACSQPNLNAAWVSAETAAGWHLIPTFVGLQAPSNSCGCAAITPTEAAAEGAADATSAAADAQAVGIEPGSPIYDDMEYYQRGGKNTSAVLAYLAAWTTALHAAGYLSGVYGNADSAIADLVSRYGTGYAEPDDIWFAQWNDVHSTATAYLPASAWSDHQRLHQYSGGSDRTYDGVTLNIDGDYVDAATVGGPPPPPPPAPSLTVSPTPAGITNLAPSWPREPGISYWRVLAGASPTSLEPVGTWGAPQSQIAFRGTSPYFEAQALGPAGQPIGFSPAVATPAHLVVIGRNAFVSANNGEGVLPAGCYTGGACSVTATITAGPTRIARTDGEPLGRNSAGVLRFQLYWRGLRMLRRSHRLAVTIHLRDASGTVAAARLTLVSFQPGASVHTRQLHHAPAVRFDGLTEFVFPNGAGGLLAGCRTVAPCRVTLSLSVGRIAIAVPHAGTVGAHELSYVAFSLNAAGRALLARAGGTLLAHAALSNPSGDAATAQVALVRVNN